MIDTQSSDWPMIILTAGLLFSGWWYSYVSNRRAEFDRQEAEKQRRFDIIEQSFDILQRLNEAALQSPEHAGSAIRSATPSDKISDSEAMDLFFHYLRINRIFRVYEYQRGGFISELEADRIILPQARTIAVLGDKLDIVLQRAYPKDFKEFLKLTVSRVAMPQTLGR